MSKPSEILDTALQTAESHIQTQKAVVKDEKIVKRVELVCRHLQNRACSRLLLACLLAKSHRKDLDIRKPYTAIGDADCYSGRTYDETYITPFINEHKLPCNSTTAFLTPALRNKDSILTPDVNLVGRPPILYQTVLQLLTDVHEERVTAEALLAETIRWLIIIRDEKRQRMETLLADIRSLDEVTLPLSAEAIFQLIKQHLHCRNASRLPVLVVAAAYNAASEFLGEQVLPLRSHLAADKQTRTLGDLEITLINDEKVITTYEMKMKRVTVDDINRALEKVQNKITQTGSRIDNYIFITTDYIDEQVEDYAKSLYEKTGGIEFVILDCLAFLRHFLHLFHRQRRQFLADYQELVLAEPDSAVSQPLKEAFLALRQAAESMNVEEQGE